MGTPAKADSARTAPAGPPKARAALIFWVPWPSISTIMSRGTETRCTVPVSVSMRASMVTSERAMVSLGRASQPRMAT